MFGCLKREIVNKLDKLTNSNEFEFHWVPHPYDLVPDLNKSLSLLQVTNTYIRTIKRSGLLYQSVAVIS